MANYQKIIQQNSIPLLNYKFSKKVFIICLIMKKIHVLLFFFILVSSITSKGQFFEFNDELFISRVQIKDDKTKGSLGLGLTTNSYPIRDKIYDFAFNVKHKGNKPYMKNVLFTADVKSIINKEFYADQDLEQKYDVALDGFSISAGMTSLVLDTIYKFSFGLSPVYSHFNQTSLQYNSSLVKDKFGLNGFLLFEYKKIKVTSSISLNRFSDNKYFHYFHQNEEDYHVNFSSLTVSSYMSNALIYYLKNNLDDYLYLKLSFRNDRFLNGSEFPVVMNKANSKIVGLGYSFSLFKILVINPEFHYRSKETFVQSGFEYSLAKYKYFYGILFKLDLNRVIIKTRVTYHKEIYGEDINANFGIEYKF